MQKSVVLVQRHDGRYKDGSPGPRGQELILDPGVHWGLKRRSEGGGQFGQGPRGDSGA